LQKWSRLWHMLSQMQLCNLFNWGGIVV
jgi:hypothetical protein